MSAPSPSPILPTRGIKPLASFLRHRKTAVAAALAVWVLGIPVILRSRPVFRSEAAVYVSSRFVRNLQGDSELELPSYTMYRDFVQQQVRTINRFDIVQGALRQLGETSGWRRPGETPQRAAERLQGALEVKPVAGTYLITVALQGPDPRGLADVVNAVCTSYMAASKDETFYASDLRVAVLRKRREELAADLEKLAADRNQLAHDLGTTSFDETKENPFDRLSLDSEVALAEARRRRLTAEERQATVDPTAPVGRQVADILAADAASKDTPLSSLKSRLTERRSALAAQLTGLTAEHPGRAAVEHELARVDAELAKATSTVLDQQSAALVGLRRAEAEEAQRVEVRLRTELAQRRQRASAYALQASRASALSADIARARAQIAQIDNRIDFLIVESDAPGFVRVVSPARVPDRSSGGAKKLLASLVLLIGLVAGLVLPVGLDLLDSRVHAANDLERVLGFPPMGWVVARSTRGAAALAEDQLLRLAATLDRERQTGRLRCFGLTGAAAGAGTTSLVLDLTARLSSGGTRALAVEANAFRPDPRFGPPDTPGLADVLAGRLALRDVIQPGADGAPPRIGVGRLDGARHLLDAARLAGVLDEAASLWDIVLVDLPPVLLSADVDRLAGPGLALVLVVRALGPGPGQIRRATRALERLRPPLFGTILNAAPPYEGGGYFHELITHLGSHPSDDLRAWLGRLWDRLRRKGA